MEIRIHEIRIYLTQDKSVSELLLKRTYASIASHKALMDVIRVQSRSSSDIWYNTSLFNYQKCYRRILYIAQYDLVVHKHKSGHKSLLLSICLRFTQRWSEWDWIAQFSPFKHESWIPSRTQWSGAQCNLHFQFTNPLLCT